MTQKTITAVLVPAEPCELPQLIELPTVGALKALYEHIGCRVVTTVQDATGHTLWCDEESLLHTTCVLNARASLAARTPIVGDVVVTGPADQRGDSTAVDLTTLPEVLHPQD